MSGKIAGRAMRVALVAAVIGVLLGCSALVPATPAPSGAKQNPIPVLAYYYIWFNTFSWDRAKTDYPLLGRYSSSHGDVVRQHVRWAKTAGIDGFIVSWKSGDALNQRLEQLIKIAEAENFKLAIIYQGLDFERDPLQASRVAADLDIFINRYAESKTFDLFDKPLVIWSGTWQFSTDEIAGVTKPRRDRLLILASERNKEGYQRLAPHVDGNAYYWSSVNPDTFPNYAGKLSEMGKAVHGNRGLWIPPAAPGFDAQLIGGTTVVERKDGATLRREFDTAMRSSPDAIGLISWNEFSENTHIEPSVNYGRRYLEVVADIQGGSVPQIPNFDSSDPGDIVSVFDFGRLVALGLLAALIFAGGAVIARRQPSVK